MYKYAYLYQNSFELRQAERGIAKGRLRDYCDSRNAVEVKPRLRGLAACGRDLIRLPSGQPPSPKGKVCLVLLLL